MTSVVQVSVDIDATPEQVWKVVSDPSNLERWDRHISMVDGPGRELRKGDRYSTELHFMGARARANMMVLELEPNRYSKVQMAGVVDGTVETWVQHLDGDRTRLRHRVEYRFKGGPLGEVAGRAVRMMGGGALLHRGVQAQKRQVEESVR
jgi:ligand-binding SRPBCC domain-containing protein